MSQRVVSLVLQWSRFFCFFSFEHCALQVFLVQSVVRSDVLGRPISRSSVEQERERGVQGEGGKGKEVSIV